MINEQEDLANDVWIDKIHTIGYIDGDETGFTKAGVSFESELHGTILRIEKDLKGGKEDE